jgi:hypothetical protein
MSDRGFIYDFLSGYNPQVVDITGKSIRFDLIFSPNDEEPPSSLIVGKELLPNSDHSLPYSISNAFDSASLASLINGPVPSIVGLPEWLQNVFWGLIALPSLPSILNGVLNGVLGPDNFKFKWRVGTPKVRARAISSSEVGNWLLLDFWVSPLSLDVGFGSLISYPYTPQTPQVFDAGPGGLGAGKYRWAVTALDGNPQLTVQGETHVSGTATHTFKGPKGSAHSATLSWPPAQNANGGYNVYRSRADGTGNVLFLVGNVPNPNSGPVSFLDSVPDSALTPDTVVSTTPPWMPTLSGPANPLGQFNYVLWPSTPFVNPPTAADGGRPGVLAPLLQGTYRYAITALSGKGGAETAASPFQLITFSEAGHVTNLSWQPLVRASGGYNIYRSLANEPGNAVFLAGHVAQPASAHNAVPTVHYTDNVPDDGLDLNTVPPTGSQLPTGWSAPSLGSLNSGSFSVSADLEFGLTVHLDSWPNAVAAPWASVLNPVITPTGATSTLVSEFQFLKDYQSAFVSLGNFFTGGSYSPSGESPGASLQGAASQVSNISLAANPFISVATSISQVEVAAQTFGFLHCRASTDPNNPQTPLTLVMTHPPDVKPFAYDLSTMGGPGQPWFSQYFISTNRGQATPGGQLGVSGSGFPSLQQMGIGWTDTCSGFVTGSDVEWGPEGEAPNPLTHLPASTNFQFRPFAPVSIFPVHLPQGPPSAGSYVFRVRNSDDDPTTPLTTTPFSDWVTVFSVGSVDLLLSYPSSGSTVPPPPGPQPANGRVVGTASVLSDGTFSTTITIPPDALPGTATLCAQVNGQSVFCIPITIVSKIQPLLRLLDPVTSIPESTEVYAGHLVTVAGEGFTPPPSGSPGLTVNLYIDQVTGTSQWHGLVGADGTFQVKKLQWPSALTAGPHTLIAVETLGGQKTVTGTLAIVVEPLT